MNQITTAQRCHLALQAFLDRRGEAKVRCRRLYAQRPDVGEIAARGER